MSTGSIESPAPPFPGPAVAPAAAATPAKPSPGPSRWTQVGHRIQTAMRYGVSASFGLWLGDVIVLAFGRAGATWTQWLTGVGAALFVCTTTALLLAAVLGPIAVPIVERVGGMIAAWWQSLRDDRDRVGPGLAAHLLTLVVLTSIWSLVTTRVVDLVLYGLSREDTMELGMVLSHLAFAATIALAWPIGLRVARAVVARSSRMRGLGWIFDRAWRVVVVFLAPVVVAGIVLAVIFRSELAATPWLHALPVVLLAPTLLATWRLPRLSPPWPTRVRRGALAVAGVLLVGSLVAALHVHPESSTAQSIGFDRAVSGRLGYAAWKAALDFDRDGQLSVLGGGDCAPFDRRRHTGAADIPGNHIDEDCDGADLSPSSLRARSWAAVGQAALPVHPNIILITVDALAAPRLQTLGSPMSFMPHLDALARDSRLFTSCFSQGPSTRLSFPSMFTSRWDSQLVFTYAPRMPYSIDGREKQLQDLLDDQGYSTVAVLPNAYFDRPRWPSVTRGFASVDTSALKGGKHNAQQVTDAALRVLSEQGERPLYMWVHYYDAHPPYGGIPGVQYPVRDDQRYYEAELQHIDDELARLLSALQQRSDPTYIVVTADHATVFHPNPETRHFHYGYDLYSATLHVPLIVHGPDIEPGRVDAVVSTMDVAPTILDLLRVTQPAAFDGWSLMPELLTTRRDNKRLLFHEFYLPEFVLRGKDPLQIVSVRDDRWNLILNRDRGTFELYDWRADYFEQHELYETMFRSPEVAHLRSSLGAFVQQFATRPDAAVIAPPEKAPEKPEL